MNWKTLEKVSIGFGLTSDQLRKWCKFIKQSLTVEMQTQRPQTKITFNCNMKTYLLGKILFTISWHRLFSQML